MGLHRLRSLRQAAVIAYAALLLVPVLLSGHHHDEPLQSTVRSNCAVCVATLHSPATSAAPLAHTAPVAKGLAVAAIKHGYVPLAPLALRSGRAPPLRAPLFSV